MDWSFSPLSSSGNSKISSVWKSTGTKSFQKHWRTWSSVGWTWTSINVWFQSIAFFLEMKGCPWMVVMSALSNSYVLLKLHSFICSQKYVELLHSLQNQFEMILSFWAFQSKLWWTWFNFSKIICWSCIFDYVTMLWNLVSACHGGSHIGHHLNNFASNFHAYNLVTLSFLYKKK